MADPAADLAASPDPGGPAAGTRARPRRPTPPTAQRAVRRGVALLHEVGLVDRLPVRARPRPSEGPRGEQAAAADVPAHRVLHPDRGARPRPVRRRRRDPPRRGHRAGPAAGARHRARPALGRGLPERRRELRGRARRARSAARRPRPERSGRDPVVRPVGARAAARRRARRPARPGRRVGRLRGDGSAVQRPAAADDGRRAAWPRRTPTGGPTTRWSPTIRPTSPTAPTTRPTSTGWRRSSASAGASCARVGTPRSSSGTPTRTGATSSRQPTSRRARERVGLVPKGDLIWYQAGTRLRPYGYPNAFVPNIAHQHILVLRRER